VVIQLVTKINLAKPFSSFVAQQIANISYHTFTVGILGLLAQAITTELGQNGYAVSDLAQFWTDSSAFVFMAAVVYVIAAIFSRGVELQNENDLTV
jgi:hypothetical protein